MDIAEDQEQAEEQLLKCQRLGERFYGRFRDEQLKMNIPFSGEPLRNGLPPHVSAGATLLPSRTEMADLGALISLALNYWVQYGQLPTVEQMRSSAESQESDSVVYITTLYSLVMGGAFLTCVCAGDLARAVSVLSGSIPDEAQPTTSPNIPVRTRARRMIGPSTVAMKPQKEEEEEKMSRHRKRDARAGNSTKNSSKKKKKSTKSSKKPHSNRK